MQCSFCLTVILDFAPSFDHHRLQVSQQVASQLQANQQITNIVMMGMGEPLHNYKNLVTSLRIMNSNFALRISHRKITVSTVGLVPKLKKLANELPVNLAISLNATTEEQRRQVMPITLKYSLAELMETCRTLPLPPNKRITFEYVMMSGFNDSLADAARLVPLLDESSSGQPHSI